MPYNETIKLAPGQYMKEYRATCRYCYGTGMIEPPQEIKHVCPTIKCPMCQGSGRVHIVKHINITITPTV